MHARDRSPLQFPNKLLSGLKALPSHMQKALAGLCLIVFGILIYPFESTVVPIWKLHVIDNRGVSISGIRVTQHWQHNSLETQGHEEMQLTDAEGIVVFAPRLIRANLISRALATPLKCWKEGFNTKTGPYASVVVWGSKENETNVATYKPGELPQAEITCARIAR
jgi:hypothetical protein